jgi:hypothetical protein
VVLPARFCERGGYKEIHEFCEGMTLCSRGHAVFDGEWFHVYCFAKPEDAERFKQRFAVRNLIHPNEGRGGIGRVGTGAKLPT